MFEEVRRAGLSSVREPFPLERIDPGKGGLIVQERRIEIGLVARFIKVFAAVAGTMA